MLDINKLDYDYFFYEDLNLGVFSLYYFNVELCTIFSKLNMENEFKEIVTQFNGEIDCGSDLFYDEEDIENCIGFLQEYLSTNDFTDRFIERIMDLYISNESDIDKLKNYLFMFSYDFLDNIININN